MFNIFFNNSHMYVMSLETCPSPLPRLPSISFPSSVFQFPFSLRTHLSPARDAHVHECTTVPVGHKQDDSAHTPITSDSFSQYHSPKAPHMFLCGEARLCPEGSVSRCPAHPLPPPSFLLMCRGHVPSNQRVMRRAGELPFSFAFASPGNSCV